MRFIAVVFILAAVSAEAASRASIDPVVLESDGLRIECRAGEVVALDEDGRELWRLLHGSLRQIPRNQKTALVRSPVLHGGRLYYGIGAFVLEVDIREGRVLRRYVFGDVVKSLHSTRQGVEVVWGREQGPYTYDERFVISPEGDEPSLRLTGQLRAHNSAQEDASDLSGNSIVWSSIYYTLKTGTPLRAERVPEVERSAELLTEQAERDPTNPFLRTELARLLMALNRSDEARLEAGRILSLDGNTRAFLMKASVTLEALGLSDIAEEAFEIGYRVFLETGHEPELVTGLGPSFVYSHPFHLTQLAHDDLDDRARLLERAWRISPKTDSIAFKFAAVARELDQAGRDEEAAVWHQLAEEARPYVIWGGGILGMFERASWGLALAAAAGFGLFASILLLVLRVAARARRSLSVESEPKGVLDKIRALRRPRHVLRREVAMPLVFCLLVMLGVGLAIPGTLAIGRAAALEADSHCGNWGSTASLMYWRSIIRDTPESAELNALAMIHAGRLDEARHLIEHFDLRTPEAVNNLGVIYSIKGDDRAARAEFEKALALNPDLQEALYNLDRPASGARVERAAEYLPGRPILAMPTPETYSAAMSYLPRSPQYYNEAGRPALFAVILVAALLALMLRPGRVKPPQEEDFDWWATLATPGLSRDYAPWGVAAFMVYAIAGAGLAYSSYTSEYFAISGLDSMMFPGHRGLTANEFFPWRGLLAAVAPALVWLLPFASAGGMIALRIGRKEGWRSGLPFRTALLRGGALCIVGTILLTWIRPLAIRLPAVIMIAAGIASVVLAWRERRAADVAESNALAKAQPEHSTC